LSVKNITTDKGKMQNTKMRSSRFGFNEMIEIHPMSNYYKMLYSNYIQGAYPEGDFYDVVQNMIDHLIHIEERHKYKEFWDVNHLMQELTRPYANKRISQVFRIKSDKEEYLYIRIQVILFDDAGDEPVLICMTGLLTEEERKLERSSFLHTSAVSLFEQEKNFFQMIDEWVKQVQPKHIVTVACDINNFKLYNDIFGRDAGDEYLKNVMLRWFVL